MIQQTPFILLTLLNLPFALDNDFNVEKDPIHTQIKLKYHKKIYYFSSREKMNDFVHELEENNDKQLH